MNLEFRTYQPGDEVWIGGNFQLCLSNEWGRFSLEQARAFYIDMSIDLMGNQKKFKSHMINMRKKSLVVFLRLRNVLFSGENCIMLVVLMMSAHYPNIQGNV